MKQNEFFKKIKNKKFLDENNLSVTSLISEEIQLQTQQIKPKINALNQKFQRQVNPISHLPEETHFIILIDIANFSKNDSRNQILYIYLFQKYLRLFNVKYFTKKSRLSSEKIRISHFIPTGDGCYMIANKCSEKAAVTYLCELISGFKKILTPQNKSIPIRVGALFGKCIPFMDIAHHLNYFGEGMNEASRILTGGQKTLEEEFKKQNQDFLKNSDSEKNDEKIKEYSENSLFVDDTLSLEVLQKSESCEEIHEFKNVCDKHGKTRNITILRNIL